MEILNLIDSVAQNYPWAPYLLVFAAPFVQEDSAVIGAAALTAAGKLLLTPTIVAIFLGLFFSDIWKYWIGWAALKNKNGEKFSKRTQVLNLKNKVQSYPFTTLIGARFIPFARIPAYIACGFFKLSYAKFCFYIAITALMYIALFFGTFHLLGALMADQLKWIIPIFGVSLIAILVIFNYFKVKKGNSNSKSDQH